jgi:methylthioribose-1-phosphate isomerase
MRTVEWDYNQNKLRLIDQRLLPENFQIVTYDDYQSVADAIQQMVVRGAPAIGVTAAFGLALAAFQSTANTYWALTDDLKVAGRVLNDARPTAVNLTWAVEHMLRVAESLSGNINDMRHSILSEAQKLADEDVAINKRMGLYGAALIDDGDTIIHHCNTGALATVDWGTALGVIRMAHEQGKRLHVLVDETRPRLQGSRLTAWELSQLGIPYDIITDNAAGYFLSSGAVKKVLFGADRVAANGDVANKIGTYMLALAAYDNRVPAYCVAPTSTIDASLQNGKLIPIEERPQDEVLDLSLKGRSSHPEGATSRNPAFDITPNRLISALITEKGVIYPPFESQLVYLVGKNKRDK